MSRSVLTRVIVRGGIWTAVFTLLAYLFDTDRRIDWLGILVSTLVFGIGSALLQISVTRKESVVQKKCAVNERTDAEK